MKKDNKLLETAVLGLVIITGLVAIYYMYQVNTGRAFLQAPQFTVVQTTYEYCCCATQNGKLFEVYGKVLKDSDDIEKKTACQEMCEVKHSTPLHPSILVNVGKCGARTNHFA
ncbi:hypothetical protein D6825_03120 [Candidatus Woesearchaeota archaeon]|nr:MAG: hypothetical protein D6825_03120 [Candidatus Woesearchaeota archaeon]